MSSFNALMSLARLLFGGRALVSDARPAEIQTRRDAAGPSQNRYARRDRTLDHPDDGMVREWHLEGP